MLIDCIYLGNKVGLPRKCKTPIISPGLIFDMRKRLFCWSYLAASLFPERFIIGGNFAFQNGLGLITKTA